MKIKRIKALFLALCLLLSVFSIQAGTFASEALSVTLQVGNSTMTVGNVYKEIDPGRGTVPIIKSDRTLVPIRAVIEEFGGSVAWNEAQQAVVLTYEESTIKLFINSCVAYVNNIEYTLDAAPEIINGRTMIPLRFVAEKFNLNVVWEPEQQLITVSRGGRIFSGTMKVHFIDVGQGDSTFIEFPGGETMLIDAGPGKKTAADYISSIGYTAVTYVVATHPDADHITGIEEVLKRFSVKEFYMPDKEHTSQTFEKMLDALLVNGCNVNFATNGQQIINNGNLSVSVLAPVRKYADNNNSSVVVKAVYGGNSFLFTGDVELDAEIDIINSGADISSDVLKVSHHGAANASSEAFIAKVNPKYAVISVGADNSYGHPTERVTGLLKKYGAQILRTDECGTVIISSDGANLISEYRKTEILPNAPPQIVQPDSENSSVVYKTKTGSKYHVAGCSYLKSSIQTTVTQAKREGLTPCSKCNPPQ